MLLAKLISINFYSDRNMIIEIYLFSYNHLYTVHVFKYTYIYIGSIVKTKY